MKTNCRKNLLTFGGFITAAQDVWDDQLAEQYVEPTMPLPSARNAVQTAWHEAGFAVRIIAKWRVAIASHVPVGYEDGRIRAGR
jgi:hypothetical protein